MALLIASVIGSIYGGIATPTEAATIGVIGALRCRRGGRPDHGELPRRADVGDAHLVHDRLHHRLRGGA
jgi:hypothetical protein